MPQFAFMWSSPDVIRSVSINVVSFSRNVVLSGLSFSLNSVSQPRMLLVRAVYVLSGYTHYKWANRRRQPARRSPKLKPPSITIVCPVIDRAMSEARNTAASAISWA